MKTTKSSVLMTSAAAALLAFSVSPVLAQSTAPSVPDANQTMTAPGAPTTNQSITNGNSSQNASQGNSGTLGMGTPVKNADGTLNASQVIGMKVVNGNNESVGKIGELIMDGNGQVSGAVVDVGGFLGIATHPVLLDWKQVQVTDQNGTTVAMVSASKDQLKQMPAYSASK
ncbi:MAG TPA: PRC-barrel domain-containing protein [Dongiaceae bacterium]|nr:PRC-barrel domain-containing protein [Dongiaceae bacterium]